jgi:hypothetical protein
MNAADDWTGKAEPASACQCSELMVVAVVLAEMPSSLMKSDGQSQEENSWALHTTSLVEQNYLSYGMTPI